jgi:hypothetical protein
MTGPDEKAAASGGHLRAAHDDREHTIEVLKTAFVQGRLDQDELRSRVGQAFTSRTYAELAALTADIPARPADARLTDARPADARPADARPARARPSGTPARTLAKAACRAGMCILAALALVGLMALTDMQFFAALAYYGGIGAMIAASGFLGYGVVDAWHERRSRPNPGTATGLPRPVWRPQHHPPHVPL